MAKAPILHGGGSILSWFDPAPEDTCEYQAMKKRGGRYQHNPCGEPAKMILVLKSYVPSVDGVRGDRVVPDRELKLCTHHLGAVANEVVSMLTALIN